MKTDRTHAGLLVLQWILGLVILGEAAGLAFSHAAGTAFARAGLPNFLRLALAWAEMAAAILFLIPRATIAGGWLLIVVLAGAIILHLAHGWLNVGSLLIYAAATWAVIAGKHSPARHGAL